MFTGIIGEIVEVAHQVESEDGLTLTFVRPKTWKDLSLGESVATNGVCLTVSAVRDNEYDCYLMTETLRKSAYGAQIPRRVNLERAMGVNDRFGGHLAQGHVDGVGRVAAITNSDDRRITVEFGPGFAELVIYKGSVAINGVSLTIAQVGENSLTVALIPHTLDHTTLSDLKVDDAVNLEFDMVGKYIANIMEKRQSHANI